MNSDFEQLNKSRDVAERMEAVMYIVTGVSVVAGLFALVYYGWLLGLGFLILGALAFGLARVFELLGELFAARATADRPVKVPASEVAKTNA